MTTTTTFQGMEPGAKSSSRVLRPPGGGSNISLGADEEKPPVRKNKMASSVFAEPEDPYANRRNNPPGGKPTGVLCGEPSAPLRRGGNHTTNHSADAPATKTVWLSLKLFQSSRKRPPQLRSQLQEHHLAAGIPPGASPASSWVESQPTSPLYLHSSLNSSFFFPPNKDPQSICLYHRNPDVQQAPVSSTSPSALF
ncbi:jupiter microtubule associated homolog 2-like isoform X1 [Seriola lalandi dorsalis]|uniref:Jupiter microtubule associated homolog 1a n=1 Tax=Seriola lalandi dorsalis TaxID=1841481 RepID=A0A3B4WNC4_SERLL|nr:jupiter microtubule associated homolog 2-like isoform X1 [Seriola lalandi dorsalis]